MANIEELEGRVSAALERIGRALDRMSEGGQGLDAELEAERGANAALEERVRAIQERQETTVAELEDENTRLRTALEERDGGLQRIRAVNEALRDANAKLREANRQGIADATLVNEAMEAEIAALRGQRATERAEIEEIVARLAPVVEEDRHADA